MIPCVTKIKISGHFKQLNGILLIIYWYIMILIVFIENLYQKINLF